MEKSAFRNFFNRRVKASSMVEVIISFVICLILFTISMRFILTVELTSNTKSRQQSMILMNNVSKLKKLKPETGTDPLLMDGNLRIEVDTVHAADHKTLDVVCLKILHSDGRLINRVNYYTKKN